MTNEERALLIAIGDAVARLLYADTYPGNADLRDSVRNATAKLQATGPQPPQRQEPLPDDYGDNVEKGEYD